MHFIVAAITTKLATVSDPAGFLVDVSTPEGKATGLDSNSIVYCLFLSTVSEAGITKVISKLSDVMKTQFNACLISLFGDFVRIGESFFAAFFSVHHDICAVSRDAPPNRKPLEKAFDR